MHKKANNIAQGTLYFIARIAWGFAEGQLPAFEAFSGRYTPALIATEKANIALAEQLGDFQARTANVEVGRIELKDLMRHATRTWQSLKRYITTAYPPEMHHIHYGAAGEDYYRAAAQQGWTKLTALMLAGKLFIDSHQAALLANNNMPATFIAQYALVAQQVTDKQRTFVHSRQKSKQDTAAKIAANNHISIALSTLLADAKVIFKNDPLLRQRFTLSHLRALVHQQHQPATGITAAHTIIPTAD